MSMRAIARNVAYANKCVTLEVLRHGTSSKDTVCDEREEVVVVGEVVQVEVEEEEEAKKPRQVGGRGTTRSNVHLSLGTSGCRNLGRLNLRQLPLPHHGRTLSPQCFTTTTTRRWPLTVVVIVIVVCGSSFSSLPKRARRGEARRRDTSLCPTWCKRAFKSRHLASRQSRQTRHTQYNARNRGGAPARALPAPFSRSRPVCPRHDTPCPPTQSLPSFPPLLRSNGRSPLARARPGCRGGVEEAPLPRSSPLPSCTSSSSSFCTSSSYAALTHTRTRESRLSFRTGSRELSYYVI